MAYNSDAYSGDATFDTVALLLAIYCGTSLIYCTWMVVHIVFML